MILVADASALIALATCKSLVLLDSLFGSVLVPEQVFIEVITDDKPMAATLRVYLQHKVRSVDMQNYVYLDAFADAGETAAMLLYKQLNADYLLIDDKRGRKVAAINRIATVGSMGVLLRAKQLGLIAAVAPLLDLLNDSPVFIGRELQATVLELAGENQPSGRPVRADRLP
jgi:uncharacterized protein